MFFSLNIASLSRRLLPALLNRSTHFSGSRDDTADMEVTEKVAVTDTVAVTDKVAFVTGAAQGIGRAIVETLLTSGAKVFFVDKDSELGSQTASELQSKFGLENVKFAALDITDHVKFGEMFQSAVTSFGHVDVMVNNAGIMNESQWTAMIDVNYKATVCGTKLATEHMRKDKGGRGGRVINVSSLAAVESHMMCPVYCGTKNAVRGYTISMSEAPTNQEQGLEFACLCPDGTMTSLAVKDLHEKILFLDILRQKPKQKFLDVSEVSAAFLQLLTQPDMNGKIFLVKTDGVRSIQAGWTLVDTVTSSRL